MHKSHLQKNLIVFPLPFLLFFPKKCSLPAKTEKKKLFFEKTTLFFLKKRLTNKKVNAIHNSKEGSSDL